MGYIDSVQVEKLARPLVNNGYGQYLLKMLTYDVRGALRYSYWGGLHPST